MHSRLRICHPTFRHARRHTDDGRPLRDIVNHRRARADYRPRSNGAPGDHVRADANERAFADEDGTAQVSPGRDVRVVADAIVMIDRAARVQNYVGADVALRVDNHPRADDRAVPNGDAGCNGCARMLRGGELLAAQAQPVEDGAADGIVTDCKDERIVLKLFDLLEASQNRQA